MEVSTEISQKIRSAIKAKLMELGAYVDDELPDYIMVMVANKRSRAQMKKDLGLFLGSHTNLFTEWLHSLLVKLQTIKSDVDKSAGKQGKGGKLKTVRNKHKGDTQVVDDLHSLAKDQEIVHSAEEKTQPDSGIVEGEKYQPASDSSREAGSSSTLIIKSENDDNHNFRPGTMTSQVDAISISEEGEAVMSVETEVISARPLGIDMNITSKISSASQSPGHIQSYSVSRKRKTPSELGDVGQESGVFHPFNPAFDSTTSELIVDNSSSLQVTRNASDDGPDRSAHNQSAEHDGQPPQKLIRLSESVQLEDIKQALAEVLEKNAVQNDDIGHFSRMLESSLRKLRPLDLSLAKMRIQQILCEFETVTVQEENKEGNQRNTSSTEETSYLSTESRFNRFDKYSRSLTMDSGHERIRSSLEEKNTSASPQTNSCLFQKKELHENSDGIVHPKINSCNLDNHLTVTCEYSSSDARVNSDPRESHVDKVVFHSKRVNSRKSSSAAENSLKVYDSGARFGDQQDQSSQSPVSLGKATTGSPSSVHSCPVSNTLSLQVKRNVSSASRESTISPVDLQSRPGSSHIRKGRPVSAKNKILPSILVNSIHNRRKSESTESASVLRQSLNKDRSPRPVESSKQDIEDSPKLYGPEALKVMAKNLRITVINKRAVKSPQESSSDDSDDEEDEDSSDNDDEEEEEGVRVNRSSIAKEKTSQKKVISGP